MARGGARAGAGRKLGQASRMNEKAREKAAQGGLMPLDYLLSIMRDKELEIKDRFAAAAAAAPYVHAKLANVQHSGDPENPVKLEMTWQPSSE